jgi:undecaprenyl-diphosphatase
LSIPGSQNFFEKLLELMGWLGRYERAALISLAVVTAGVWGFVELTDEVMEGTTEPLDRAIVLAMRSPHDSSDPRGPRWVEETGRDVTALGGVAVLVGTTAATLGYLLLQRQVTAALLVVSAVTGGIVVSFALKGILARPRPDLVPHGSYVYTSSFPSGHAMLSATTYLTLGALLARLHSRRRMKAYIMLWAVVVTVAVGVSRVYLGVHWPTDVLAGWTLGACWALLCWTVAYQLQRSGQLPQKSES